MKRIEFLGAPGVGKSTLYKELKRPRSRNWLTSKDARRQAYRAYIRKNTRSIKDYINLLLLHMPFFESTFLSAYFERKYRLLLWERRKKLKHYFEIALRGVAKTNNKDALRKIYGMHLFYESLREFIITDDNTDTELVLFDELLAQRVYSVIECEDFDSCKELVIEYFNQIPIPTGLVHCYLRPDKLIKRISERPKTLLAHKELSTSELIATLKNQLETASAGADILRKRGVQILHVDMDNPIRKNNHEIRQFINDLK